MKAPANLDPFGFSALARVLDDGAADVRAKVITIYVLLISVTLAAWMPAIAAFATWQLLLGTAFMLPASDFVMRSTPITYPRSITGLAN